MATRYRRFRDISVSERLLDTLFLATIGLGYLFALAHLYYTHANRDGEPGLSVEDVRIAYYGSQDQTRLGSAINGGPMEANLKNSTDKKIIMRWLYSGKKKRMFEKEVAPILNRDCTICHNPESNPSLPNLTTYQGVMEVAQSKAASLPMLIKVSHIHLFGIAFILFFVGKIFILCDLNTTLKRTVVIIPFLAMLIDILSWYPARTHPEFAYVVVGSGALLGLSMAFQIIISLYQMWVHPFHPSISLAKSEQNRIKELIETLQGYDYEVFKENNGWLIKESQKSWHFLTSMQEMEAYVKDIQIHHQAD